MSTAAPVPEPAQGRPQENSSSMMRVLQTVYAPTKAFVNLNAKTAWILPWIVISVVTLGFMFTVEKKITFDKVVENQLKLSPKQSEALDRMPEAQRERQIQARVTGTKFMSYASPVTVLLLYGIFALLYWGTLTFACGARLNFWSSLSVTMLGGIPGVIKMILAIIVIFAGVDPDGFNINNPLATNIGSFFDPIAHPFIATFGSFVDIFMIWMLIVIAIGFSTVTKVKRSSAMMVTFGWCAFFALIFGGIAFAFS